MLLRSRGGGGLDEIPGAFPVILHSALITFSACGLRWVADLELDGVAGLTLDRLPPRELRLQLLSCFDGRGRPVHPRYQTPLLRGEQTLAMIRSAAAEAFLAGVRRLAEPPSGEVLVQPELCESPEEALNRWLPMNLQGPMA